MISIGRACGFIGLGIMCIVLGLSFNPVMAAKAGALMTTGLAVILLLRAWQAPTRDYRKTELWVMLKKDERPKPDYAQAVAGQALQEAYMMFANHVAIIAGAVWIMAIFLALVLPPGFTF